MGKYIADYLGKFLKIKAWLKSRVCWSLLLTAILWLKSLWFVFHRVLHWFLVNKPEVYGHPYGMMYDIVEQFSEGAAYPHGSFLFGNIIAIVIAYIELVYGCFGLKRKIWAPILSIVLNLIFYAIIFVYIYYWSNFVFRD